MPNWCMNGIQVRVYNADHVEPIRKLLVNEHGTIDFNIVAPMPEILRRSQSGSHKWPDGSISHSWYSDPDTKEERKWTDAEIIQLDRLGANSWYDWRIANWGCKWNCNDSTIHEVDHHDAWDSPSGHSSPELWNIHAYFETPWGPPLEWFKALRDEIPREIDKWRITLDWWEPGVVSAGSIRYELENDDLDTTVLDEPQTMFAMDWVPTY